MPRLLFSALWLAAGFLILRAAWAEPGEPHYERRADGAVGPALLLIPMFGMHAAQSVADVLRGTVSEPLVWRVGKRLDAVPGGLYLTLGLMLGISAVWLVLGH